MDLLKAVNYVLPKLGTNIVTRVDIRHPDLAVLLPIIELTRQATLVRGWWFNKYRYTVYPNEDGELVLGEDALTFIADKHDEAFQRGRKLFNPRTGNFQFTAPVSGQVIQDVAYDDLPLVAQHYVMCAALSDAYLTDIGTTEDLQNISGLLVNAHSNLLSEHLRHKKFSTRRNSSRWHRINSARYS